VPSWARYDIWNVGIATLDRPLEDIADLATLANVRWLPPQAPLHLLADPFPYRHDGRDWLLAEHYGHARGVRGRIVRVDPSEAADAASASPAIVRGHHVSYPCTFTDGDRTYCVPEMSQEDGCVIYALDRGGDWAPALHILRGVRVVDPTVSSTRTTLTRSKGRGRRTRGIRSSATPRPPVRADVRSRFAIASTGRRRIAARPTAARCT